MLRWKLALVAVYEYRVLSLVDVAVEGAVPEEMVVPSGGSLNNHNVIHGPHIGRGHSVQPSYYYNKHWPH